MDNLLKNLPTKCLFYVHQTTFKKIFAYERSPTKLFSMMGRLAQVLPVERAGGVAPGSRWDPDGDHEAAGQTLLGE